MKKIYVFAMAILFTTNVFAKTGYESVLIFDSKGWSTQKTPTGLALSCQKCENQVMVSMDIVPVDKNNKFTNSNAEFVSYLAANKNQVAIAFAKDAAIGKKIKLLRADKAKIGGKESFRYMFLADMGSSGKSFDNTSLLLHKGKMIKITLNYFHGYFSKVDTAQVENLYRSIKFTQ